MQGFRRDINKFCKNVEEANIERIKLKFNVNTDNIEYSKLENDYKNLIPLWEDSTCNLKKYPLLYNERWIVGKREKKRVHNKLFVTKNGFKFKIGFLWKKQPFDGRPTFGIHKKFVKNFKAFDINNIEIVEDENWGSILAKTQQYIKDNAKEYYENYENKITIKGYCKSEDTWFDIVEFDVLKNDWKI